jgi:S-DNA-T family DNA segregation ATPase FtsK/SpoIIIE
LAVAQKHGSAPLPARLAGLVREAKWLLLGVLALYLFLVFVTYSRGDPGWSHSAADAVARNAGGVVGAYIADIFLYLFGLSAYWWVVLCAAAVALWDQPGSALWKVMRISSR